MIITLGEILTSEITLIKYLSILLLFLLHVAKLISRKCEPKFLIS